MEMKAFKRVFSKPIPVYSIKGGTGHTLGAAGLVEMIIGIKSLRENIVPLTVGLSNVDGEAEGWVNKGVVRCNNPITLSVNAGFGGVNAALILGKC
jgi:3-oxoacyl-(acyl-carrier-protein) synthase